MDDVNFEKIAAFIRNKYRGSHLEIKKSDLAHDINLMVGFCEYNRVLQILSELEIIKFITFVDRNIWVHSFYLVDTQPDFTKDNWGEDW